jgi:hypothetical protein
MDDNNLKVINSSIEGVQTTSYKITNDINEDTEKILNFIKKMEPIRN